MSIPQVTNATTPAEVQLHVQNYFSPVIAQSGFVPPRSQAARDFFELGGGFHQAPAPALDPAAVEQKK